MSRLSESLWGWRILALAIVVIVWSSTPLIGEVTYQLAKLMVPRDPAAPIAILLGLFTAWIGGPLLAICVFCLRRSA